MSLKNYLYKTVSIITKAGNEFRGVVTDYLFPDENETGNESIIVELENGRLIEFEPQTIQSINL